MTETITNTEAAFTEWERELLAPAVEPALPQVGDRVRFLEVYGDANIGDLGTVTYVGINNGPGVLVGVDLDNGYYASAFAFRMEVITPDHVLDVAGIAALPVGTVLREVKDEHADQWIVSNQGMAYGVMADETQDNIDGRSWKFEKLGEHGSVESAIRLYGPFEVVSYGPDVPEVEAPVIVMDGEGLAALPLGSTLREVHDIPGSNYDDTRWIRVEDGLKWGEDANFTWELDRVAETWGPFELLSEPEIETPTFVLDVEGAEALTVGSTVRDIEGDIWTRVEGGMLFDSPFASTQSFESFAEHDVPEYGPFEVVEYGPDPEPEPVVEAPTFTEGDAVRITDEATFTPNSGEPRPSRWVGRTGTFVKVSTFGPAMAVVTLDSGIDVLVDIAGLEAIEAKCRLGFDTCSVCEVIEAPAEPEPKAFGFEVGDRVRFVEDYSGTARTGDVGTVTEIDLPVYDEGLLYIALDNGHSTSCFPYRVELVTDEGPVFIHEVSVLHDLDKGSAVAVPNGALYVRSKITPGMWYSPELMTTRSPADLADTGFRVIYTRL